MAQVRSGGIGSGWPYRSWQFWCGLLAGVGIGLLLGPALSKRTCSRHTARLGAVFWESCCSPAALQSRGDERAGLTTFCATVAFLCRTAYLCKARDTGIAKISPHPGSPGRLSSPKSIGMGEAEKVALGRDAVCRTEERIRLLNRRSQRQQSVRGALSHCFLPLVPLRPPVQCLSPKIGTGRRTRSASRRDCTSANWIWQAAVQSMQQPVT